MRLTLFVATFTFGAAIGMLVVFKPPPKSQPPITLFETLSESTGQEFSFSRVIEDTTGNKIIPLDPNQPGHTFLRNTILQTSAKIALSMSSPDSPAREKKRINEVSALFENALLQELDSHPDLSCQFPPTRTGNTQRSGYPDLRVEHQPSGTIAYLDPKLFAENSRKSSFRTFYFEPAGETTKVNENALHFLIGFPHDANSGHWKFGPAELVDLSGLTVTLKAEFSASNRNIYSAEN